MPYIPSTAQIQRLKIRVTIVSMANSMGSDTGPPLVDLRERGIDEPQAADLRLRLTLFAEDWDRPEMTAYDELPPR